MSNDRIVHSVDLDGTRALAEDGSKAYVKVDGTSIVFNGTGQLKSQILWDSVTTPPAVSGNTGNLPRFERTPNGAAYFVDTSGTAHPTGLSDTVTCKGAHYEQVNLVPGTSFTVTHGFALSNPLAIDYSVRGSTGSTGGDWPTGVRFINHTANTVDVIADGIGGFVDVALINIECLGIVSRGSSSGDPAVVAILQNQINALQAQVNALQIALQNSLLDAFE